MYKQRIISVHLLNDLSGSPFVFRQALQLLVQQLYEVHLFTSRPSGDGFLSGLPQVVYHRMPYRWSRNKWMTLILYLTNQVVLFMKILSFARKEDIIYCNSILPFGAALAGKLKGCSIVYHIHEVSVRPAMLKKMLLSVVNATARKCIFVSEYCRQQTAIRIAGRVIYNALPTSFTGRVATGSEPGRDPFVVLMVCSLKIYKGVLQFLECAAALPGIRFELVLNASAGEIDAFFADRQLPHNLYLYPAQNDIHPFYSRSSVVLNLSLPDQWIETFGMTVLEAMYYGRPVIIPPVGGVTELVEDGSEGFYVDSRRIEELVTAICVLSENEGIYKRMSRAAYKKARSFTKTAFDQGVTEVFRRISGQRSQNKESSITYS